MELFFCEPEQIENGLITPDRFEQKHIVQTLRKKENDIIYLTDGAGESYQARISRLRPQLQLQIIERKTVVQPRSSLSIAIGYIRSSRLDWLLEKAVEMGVRYIYLIKMQYSAYGSEKTKRFNKILRQALKQSLQYYLPEIIHCPSVEEFVIKAQDFDHKIVAVSREYPGILSTLKKKNISESSNIVITIGPEGGLHENETEQLTESGFLPVSLGQTRLRAETAGLYGLAAVQSYLMKQKEDRFGKR